LWLDWLRDITGLSVRLGRESLLRLRNRGFRLLQFECWLDGFFLFQFRFDRLCVGTEYSVFIIVLTLTFGLFLSFLLCFQVTCPLFCTPILYFPGLLYFKPLALDHLLRVDLATSLSLDA